MPGSVTLTVYIALVVHLVVTYGLFLKAFHLGGFKFLKGAKEAMITAFVTISPSGTLPVTLRCSEANLGVPRGVSPFTLPLGATVNKDGTSIYRGICALFVAFAVGQDLTFSQQMTIVITAPPLP